MKVIDEVKIEEMQRNYNNKLRNRKNMNEFILTMSKDKKGRLINAFQDKDKLKKKAEMDAIKLNENNQDFKEKDSNVFDSNLEDLMVYINQLNEENKYFSKKYNWHHERTVNLFQKVNRINLEPVDVIFHDLVDTYVKRKYKIQKISEMKNIFSPSVMLLEEGAVSELVKEKITQEMKETSYKELFYITNLKNFIDKDKKAHEIFSKNSNKLAVRRKISPEPEEAKPDVLSTLTLNEKKDKLSKETTSIVKKKDKDSKIEIKKNLAKQVSYKDTFSNSPGGRKSVQKLSHMASFTSEKNVKSIKEKAAKHASSRTAHSKKTTYSVGA